MYRTLSIKVRLVLSGLFGILGVCLIAGTGLQGLSDTRQALEDQLAETAALRWMMIADMMHDALSGDVARAIVIGPEGPMNERADLQAALADNIETFRTAISTLRGMDLNDLENEALAAVMPVVEDYLISAESTVALAFKDPVASRAGLETFMVQYDVLEEQLGRFGDLIQQVAAEKAQAARERGGWVMQLLVGVSAVIILLAVTNAAYITRSVSRPIERLRAALREVAAGELGIRIGDITRNDDIGAIARDIDKVTHRIGIAVEEQTAMRAQSDQVITRLGVGLRSLSSGDFSAPIHDSFAEAYEPLRSDFNHTVVTLRHLITQVVETCENIRARSSEMRESSESLATRTETQAATLQETAAALEQMTVNVNTAAGNAREVEAVVLRTRGEAEESGRVVQGAVAVMTEIDTSSSQISQIIGVIDDIAFQTNLLALNAGVEAARAGDAGRGFAVVASEVRALAQRSSAAAKEIKALISDSTQHVGRGVEQVGRAGAALASIVDKVAHISTLMSDIAQGASQQSTGLGEINLGVTQLDQVTQQNAAMVEESSAASHSLYQEATTLSSLIGSFRTEPVAERGMPSAQQPRQQQRAPQAWSGQTGRAA